MKNSKQQSSAQTIKRLWRYIDKRKLPLVLGIVLMLVGSLASVLVTALLKPAINSLVSGQDWEQFIYYVGIIIVTVIVNTVVLYFGNVLVTKVGVRTSADLRAELFSHMQDLSVAYFDQSKLGDLMSSYTNDIDNINNALLQSLPGLLGSILTIVASLIMMIILSPLLTLVLLITIIFMFVAMARIGKSSATAFRAQQESLGELNAFVEESIEGVRESKSMNHEATFVRDFIKRNDIYQKAATKAQSTSLSMMPIMTNISYVQYAVIAMLGAYMVVLGKLDIGSIASFLQYVRSFSQPISQLGNQMNVIIAAIAGAERVFKVLDEVPELDEGQVSLVRGDGEQSYWLVPQGEGIEPKKIPLRAEIVFKDVCFSYAEGKPVLKNINLYAKPGQKIALVGSTGAGKTTISNLLNRFYDVDSGSISFDGIDIRDIKKADLRSTMAVVLQEVNLFEESVADNIRYGKLDADDEELMAAAKLSYAHSFVKHLPDKYSSVLSNNADSISQGQRQLLAIARAAIADPVILVLDEATSSIDTHTESLVQKAMDRLMSGRTSFTIAHRLSTVRHANVILVLEHGEIIERGAHDELMKLQGRYYELNRGLLELD